MRRRFYRRRRCPHRSHTKNGNCFIYAPTVSPSGPYCAHCCDPLQYHAYRPFRLFHLCANGFTVGLFLRTLMRASDHAYGASVRVELHAPLCNFTRFWNSDWFIYIPTVLPSGAYRAHCSAHLPAHMTNVCAHTCMHSVAPFAGFRNPDRINYAPTILLSRPCCGH